MTEVPEPGEADAVAPLPSLAEARGRRRRVPRPPEPPVTTEPDAVDSRRSRAKRKRDRRRQSPAEPAVPPPVTPAGPAVLPPVTPVSRPAPRIPPPEAPPMYPPGPEPEPVAGYPTDLYLPPPAPPAYPDPPLYQDPRPRRTVPYSATEPKPEPAAPISPPRPVSPPRPRTFTGPPIPASKPARDLDETAELNLPPLSPPPPEPEHREPWAVPVPVAEPSVSPVRPARRLTVPEPTEPVFSPAATRPEPGAADETDELYPVTPSAAVPVTPSPVVRQPQWDLEPVRPSASGGPSARRVVLLAVVLAVLVVGVTAVVTFDPFGSGPAAKPGASEPDGAGPPPTGEPADPDALPASADDPALPPGDDYRVYSWSTRKCVGQAGPRTDPRARYETVLSSCDDKHATVFLAKAGEVYRFQPHQLDAGDGGCVVPNGTGEGRGFRDGDCAERPQEYFHLDDVHGDGFTDVFRIRGAESDYCMTLDGTAVVQRTCAAGDPGQQFVLKAA